MWHPATKSATEALILGHHTRENRAAHILRAPRWPPSGVQCCSSMSSYLRPPPRGMTSCSVPSAATRTSRSTPCLETTLKSGDCPRARSTSVDMSVSVPSKVAVDTRCRKEGSTIKVLRRPKQSSAGGWGLLDRASGTTAALPSL